MKIVITLNQEQAANLVIFLQRTKLDGKEVPAYMEIVNAVNGAQRVEEKSEQASVL